MQVVLIRGRLLPALVSDRGRVEIRMQMMESGVACETGGSPRLTSCTYPSMVQLPSGKILLAFRTAPKKLEAQEQRIVLCSSEDGGSTYTSPRVAFEWQESDGIPGMFHTMYLSVLQDGTLLGALEWHDASTVSLPYYNEETQGILETRIFLTKSADEGATWSTPQRVLAERDAPAPLTGPVLELGGRLALPHEINKPYYSSRPYKPCCALAFSSDDGKTWTRSYRQTGRGSVFHWEQRPCALANGNLVNFFWTFDGDGMKFKPISACISGDFGKTWSDFWDTGLPGQPGNALQLPDGRLALIYVERGLRSSIKLAISGNAGRSFEKTELLYQESAGGHLAGEEFSSGSSRYSMGQPGLIQLQTGEYLAYFYTGRNPDTTEIQYLKFVL